MSVQLERQTLAEMLQKTKRQHFGITEGGEDWDERKEAQFYKALEKLSVAVSAVATSILIAEEAWELGGEKFVQALAPNTKHLLRTVQAKLERLAQLEILSHTAGKHL